MIIDNGWSGVTFWNGNAYFKNVDYLLNEETLDLKDDCITWVYDTAANTNTLTTTTGLDVSAQYVETCVDLPILAEAQFVYEAAAGV